MVVTRRSFLVMFHFETILDCANRLNLSSESNVSTLVRDFPVRVNLNSHIGEAIYDYCIMAGIGGGQHGPSVVELMSLLKFVVHTGPFEAIYISLATEHTTTIFLAVALMSPYLSFAFQMHSSLMKIYMMKRLKPKIIDK